MFDISTKSCLFCCFCEFIRLTMYVLFYLNNSLICFCELFTENVGQFRAVTIPTTGHFLNAIIVITWRQQMSKYKLRNIDFLLLVKSYRNALSIIPNLDQILATVYCHFDHSHLAVSMIVVGRVNQYFICTNFTQTDCLIRCICYLPKIL